MKLYLGLAAGIGLATAVVCGLLIPGGPLSAILIFAGLAAAGWCAYRAGRAARGAKAGGGVQSERLYALSETLGFDSQQLIWTTDKNLSAFKELVATSGGIARIAQQNNEQVSRLRVGVGEIVDNSSAIDGYIENVTTATASSIETLSQSEQLAGQMKELCDKTQQAFLQIRETTDQLYKFSDVILKFVDSIHEISKQTNLLATNASIEAARAGAAGTGFQVVAREVRSLANQTDESARKIEEINAAFVQNIERSRDITLASGERVERLAEISARTVDTFENTRQVMRAIGVDVATLAQASKQNVNGAAQMAQVLSQVEQSVEMVNNGVRESIGVIMRQQKQTGQQAQVCKTLGDVCGRIQHVLRETKTDKEIIFGVNPFTSPADIKKMYVPILERVFASMGLTVHTLIVKDYDDLSSQIASGSIDVGWFSPFAYVNAHKQIGVVPLATPRVNGKTSYNGYIISKKSSGIRSLEQLKGRSFAYVDTKSASGYLFARYILKQAGMNPEAMFSKVSFAGSHDKVIAGVLSGEYEGGATYNEAYEKAKASGLAVDELSIIATTPDIQKDAIAASKDLPEKLCTQIRQAFLQFNQFSGIETPVDGFIEAKDENYDLIRSLE